MKYDPDRFCWKGKLVSDLDENELKQVVCQLITDTMSGREKRRLQYKYMHQRLEKANASQ